MHKLVASVLSLSCKRFPAYFMLALAHHHHIHTHTQVHTVAGTHLCSHLPLCTDI